MAAPTYTGGAAGNLRTSATLAAGTTASTFDVDATTYFEARMQVGANFGTIATPAGLQIRVLELIGSTPVADTVSGPGSQVLGAVAGAQAVTIHLPTGRWRVELKNLDATNPLTNVYATADYTPAIV